MEFEKFIQRFIWLACTFCPADQGWPRCSSAALPGPGEQDTDVVLCVWLQMPYLIGKRANTMSLRPCGLAGSVLYFPPNDWAIPHNGVGVKLDDQICGACPQELGGCNRCRGDCKKECDVNMYIIILTFLMFCYWFYFTIRWLDRWKNCPWKQWWTPTDRYCQFQREKKKSCKQRRSQGFLSWIFSFLFYSFNNIISALLEHWVIKCFIKTMRRERERKWQSWILQTLKF